MRLTEQEYQKQLKKINLANESKVRKMNLKSEKQKYNKKMKLPSTSKLILLVVILLCLEIVFFSEFVMLHTGDVSALYTLIGVPVTLVPVIWGYYAKAKIENSVGGISYDMAMAEFNMMQNSEEESKG